MSVQNNIQIEAIGFKPFRKNTLIGFCDLHLPAVGLTLLGCTLHSKNESRWVGLPARAYTTEKGEQAWAQIIEYADKDARYAFQRAALAAVEKLEEVSREGGANGF